MRDLLDADPSLLERGDDGGATPLHRAVGASQRRVAELLLDRGANIHAIRGVPAVVTGCQTYLMERPDMLRTLLDHGMSPDTCNWQHQTMLHMLCRPQGEISKTDLECAAMLLDAGANISARDDEYRSTPLAWAARHSNLKMVKFLLSRGAPMNLPDDKPWATPLAWATRRGHKDVIDLLRAAGAAT